MEIFKFGSHDFSVTMYKHYVPAETWLSTDTPNVMPHTTLVTTKQTRQKHLQGRNFYTAPPQRQYCFAIKLLILYFKGCNIFY